MAKMTTAMASSMKKHAASTAFASKGSAAMSSMFPLATSQQTAKHTKHASDKAMSKKLASARLDVTAMPIAPAIPNACSPLACSPPHAAMTPFVVPIASVSK
jgi:microcystin-dependent protein